MNMRAQANAEFLARELASARISLGRMEAALARIESEQRERDERGAGARDAEGEPPHTPSSPSGGGAGKTSIRFPTGSRRKRRGAPHRSGASMISLPCAEARSSVSSKSSTCRARCACESRACGLALDEVDVVAVRQLEPCDACEVLDLS